MYECNKFWSIITYIRFLLSTLNKLGRPYGSHRLKYIFDEFYVVLCRTINPHHIIK